MKIDNPDVYFGKKIKVVSYRGVTNIGELYGYNYDFDDNENEFLEFDVEVGNGRIVSYTENEIESIEVID